MRIINTFNEYNSLAKNKITSKGASLLFDFLREYKINVESIVLASNQIDDSCVTTLGDFLKGNLSIESIDLSGMMQDTYGKLTDKGMETLSQYMDRSCSLKRLNISRNNLITDVGLPYLYKIITGSMIKELIFWGTSIKSSGPLIFVAIEMNKLKIGEPKISISNRYVCYLD